MLYTGKNVAIRNWQQGDESYLALHANNFNIWKYVRDRFPHPYTYDDALVWIAENLKLDIPVNFALVVDDEPVGAIGFVPGVDVYKKSLEIGYWVSEAYWGQGIASEALTFMVSYCFENFEINRIWAAVFSNNAASERVLVKSGFTKEAELKNAVYKDNTFLDELIYSKLK